MSLLLPPSDSPIRELFDMNHLASLSNPLHQAELHTLNEAESLAAQMMGVDPEFSSVNMLVLEGRELSLVEFPRVGGFNVLWNFGVL